MKMDRKKFLINGVSLLGLVTVAPHVLGSKPAPENDEKSNCVVSPSETAGPFPTISPGSLVQTNIVGDRTGVAFTINIKIRNNNDDCGPLAGALVDIWHCDKDGNYSEYGGTAMQQTNYTNVHFLRGRQTTDSNGDVSFVSIFPGWYTSRATHIHVHIYNAAGTSLLVTQISFPEGSGSAVELVNSATAYGYTKGMNGYTYNANDNVFSDDATDAEMGSISGSVSNGYILTHEIRVNGPVLGVNDLIEPDFDLSPVYPDPIDTKGYFVVALRSASRVSLQILDLNGRFVTKPVSSRLAPGNHTLTFDREGLPAGIYLYKITVENENGTFEKSNRLMMK
ncbi:Chlorocatechol 1,2-dioxygenase [compost metagenome]